jgi:hypothetical protein
MDQKRFNTIEEIPIKYQSVVRRLIENGQIELDDSKNLNLTEDMLRIILIIGRLGLL